MSVEAVANGLIQFEKAKMPKRNSETDSKHIQPDYAVPSNTVSSNAASSAVQAAEQAKGQVQNQSQKYDSVMAEKAVENANNRIKVTRTNAKFKFDKDINRITITITDQDNEVIREIPPEATQKMLERIHTFSGMMVDREV